MQRCPVLPALVLLLAACAGGDDAPPASSEGESGATSAGEAAMLLSTDPVDQINVILARGIESLPGEGFEVRFQVRLLPGDTLAVDYEQREAGEPWEANATAVATLGSIAAEVARGRLVSLTCEKRACLEHRAPLDELDLGRLPAGEGRERFLGILTRLSSGETDVAAEGGEDEINRLLRASAASYSETVSSWYQVSFSGDWMEVSTWQHTQGFTEHTLPARRLAHLPTLAPMGAAEPIPCGEPGCVLVVRETPLRFVLSAPEDAERLAALINGLGEDGS